MLGLVGEHLNKEVVGLIGPLEGKGKGRVTRRFALVFTENELICVKIGGTLSIFTAVLGEAVDSGYGLPTITDVYNRLSNKRVDKLKNLRVQDILDLDKLNFSIPYNNVEKIEVKKKSILSPKGRRIIEIKTKSKKYWFRIVEEKSFNDYVDLVKRIFPNKT
jgi:hypothetical protein